MELTDEERELLLAIVDRGDVGDDLPNVHGIEHLSDMDLCPHIVTDIEGTSYCSLAEHGPTVKGVAYPEPPGRYVPEETGVLVGWLGKDCPDGWEWSQDGVQWWESDGGGIANNHLGMIRPAPRPDVVVAISAEDADWYVDTNRGWREGTPPPRLAQAISAARDEDMLEN